MDMDMVIQLNRTQSSIFTIWTLGPEMAIPRSYTAPWLVHGITPGRIPCREALLPDAPPTVELCQPGARDFNQTKPGTRVLPLVPIRGFFPSLLEWILTSIYGSGMGAIGYV